MEQLPVQILGPERSQTERAFSILKDRIERRCACQVIEVNSAPAVILAVDRGLPGEGFCIRAEGEGVRISGGSALGLLYGTGKFLRTSSYTHGFEPSSWRGESAPQGQLRGMYFASHFRNWYQEASQAEITRYIEDLALWGVNAVMLCAPFIDLSGWDDPQAENAIAMLRRLVRAVRETGLRVGIGAGNTLFSGIPAQLRATPLPDPTGRRGNHGHPICPSLAEGHTFLMETYQRLFERLQDVGLDFLVHWPYDEGGCACADCLPWGSHGFLKLSKDLTRLGQAYFPGLEAILSTWMFDTPPEGEWQGLSDALALDRDWVQYILADSHEDFPRYPLEHALPGGLSLLNFPEISMWGNWPWGGMGANPLPARFQALWDQVRHLVQGGLPYSEGIYEDMNKAVVAQFYWDRERSAQDTLREYSQYEFGPLAVEKTLALVELLEDSASHSYRRQAVDAEKTLRAWNLAEEIQAALPEWARSNWRWEILYCRARLDHERYAGGGLHTPAAEASLLRLVELYHCQLETDDPYHHRVRPPTQLAISRHGEM